MGALSVKRGIGSTLWGDSDCRPTEDDAPCRIRTTMNVYGDVVTDAMAQPNPKVEKLALVV